MQENKGARDTRAAARDAAHNAYAVYAAALEARDDAPHADARDAVHNACAVYAAALEARDDAAWHGSIADYAAARDAARDARDAAHNACVVYAALEARDDARDAAKDAAAGLTAAWAAWIATMDRQR